MIPTRLHLQNFLSYRDQTIDLSELSLAVITGENGAGKSAILAGIVYAGWGEGRKADGDTKPDDTLMNNHARNEEGATRMGVRYEFTVERQNETIPCVIERSYRRTASGKTTSSNLQFWIDGEEVTSGTMAETQELIDETIGLSYELFTATSLFQQDQWDKLLQMTPGERKDVFFKLLQLSQFDDLKARAKTKRDEAQDTITGLSHEENQLRGKDQDTSTIKDQIASLKSEKELVQTHVNEFETAAEVEAKIDTLRKEYKTLQTKKNELEANVTKLTDKISAKTTTKTELVEEIEELSTADPETLQAKKEKTERKLKVLDEERQLEREKHNRYLELREQYQDMDQQIQNEIKDLKREIQTKKEAANKAAAQEKKLATKWERRREIQSAYWELEPSYIDDDIAAQKEIVDAIKDDLYLEDAFYTQETKAVETLEEAEEGCPTCGAQLSEEQIEDIQEQALLEMKDIEEAIDKLEDELDDAEKHLNHLEGIKTDIEAHRRDMNEIEREIRDDLHSIRQAREEASDLDVCKEHLQDLQDKHPAAIEELVGRDYFEVRSEKEALEETGFTTQFTSSVEEDISEARTKLQSIQEELNQLDKKEQMEARVEELTAIIDDLKATRETTKEKVKTAQTKMGETEDEAQVLKQDHLTTEEVCTHATEDTGEEIGSKDDLSSYKESIISQIADANAQLKQIKKDKQRLEEINELKEEAQLQVDAASQLVDAFGRDGVPRMLLERALPAIERRSNVLLDNLGTNLRVQFRTEREKKTGGRTATFDIQVREGQNEMPYQGLSGGQKFRVTLAVRLALSQYLSARTGRPVRTLIIDEGFGTLDTEGRLAAQQAIAEASEDFKRVLVITHIETFKDAFPQRIDVERTIEGSSAVVHA